MQPELIIGKLQLATLLKTLSSTDQIEGDVVECGVYKGGSAFEMAKVIHKTYKQLHLFDSFEGFGPRSLQDNTYDNVFSKNNFEQVKEVFCEYSFVNLYKGWIPEVFSLSSISNICFAHVDVDLYAPTKDSLEFIWPKLSIGGKIIVDDYFCWQCEGCTIAVNNFVKNKKANLVVPNYESTCIITKLDV